MTDIPVPPPLPEPPPEQRHPAAIINVDDLLARAREQKEEEEAQAEESQVRKHMLRIREEREEDAFPVDTPKTARERKRTAATRQNARARAFMEGDLKPSDLTDEELRKGRFMDSDGRIRNREASLVPREFHDEFLRRLLERGHERLRQDFLGAIDTVTEIMYDADNNEAVRLRAAELIINRFAGKPQENVAVSVEVKPWEEALKGIIRTKAPDDAIDAEIVEDDDE